MIPTIRFVWLIALGLPIALLGLFGQLGLAVAAGYDLALVLFAVLDRLAAGDPRLLELRREMPARWIQGRADRVRLDIRWRGRRNGIFLVRDVPPSSFSAPPDPPVFALRSNGIAEMSYEAVPRERGDHLFGPIAVRSRGWLGLIERQIVHDLRRAARVFPDLVSLSAREAALVAPASWLAGTRRGPVHGEGREFHQLREYIAGDDTRQIDWKAFARHGRPAVREYRAERNQRVLLVIDSGRLMTARVGDRLRFDWAIQAAGRLARVALAFGDTVGLAFFSRDVRSILEPFRGAGHLGRLTESLCLAQPDMDEPDLGAALRALLHRNPRRTLVVVFTEIADPRAAGAAVKHIGSLAPRHLGLVVTLADADLEAARNLPSVSADAAYQRVAAEELWQDYRRTEHALESRGALVVRARADALAGETVERYLEIKRRGKL